MDLNQIAEPLRCERCSEARTLIHVVGKCADCIADMGLRHPEEYQQFKRDVFEKFSSPAG